MKIKKSITTKSPPYPFNKREIRYGGSVKNPKENKI